jgi:aminotransferase EvaB
MTKLEYLPIFNMQAKLAKHSETIQIAIGEVIDSGSLILGEFVERFESNFAKYLEIKNCIGVGNGTDAIEIALRSLNLEDKALIGIVANAGGYSRIAIDSIGLTPVYADVDEDSNCMNLENALTLIDLGVSTIIVTHLYGRVAPDIREIVAACKSAGVWLIEDCAQAHGSSFEQTKAGRFGDLATFSFYPTKNLGGVGDAGCIVTNNPGLADHIRRLRTYGWSGKYNVLVKNGRNSRIDSIQARVLDSLLLHLDAENAERRVIASKVKNSLSSDFLKLLNSEDSECNFHLMLVRTAHRSKLEEHLNDLNIGSAIHYPIPDHKQIAWIDELNSELPITEKLASEVLSVPCYPGMTDLEINRLVKALNSFNPR